MEHKLNYEMKHFCRDFLPIRRLLRSIGAKKISDTRQTDWYFYLPSVAGADARLKFRLEDGKRKLVFYRRGRFNARKEAVSHILIYRVGDKKLQKFLAEALGIDAVVRKRRERWRKGNAVFHLDTVAGAGKIFEIEVWATSRSARKDKENFCRYQKMFLPYLGAAVRGSNRDLVKRK